MREIRLACTLDIETIQIDLAGVPYMRVQARTGAPGARPDQRGIVIIGFPVPREIEKSIRELCEEHVGPILEKKG